MLPQILMTLKGLVLLTGAVYGFAALLGKEDAAWVKRGPLAIFLSMFVVGMWGHNVWIAYAAILVALPILARGRADAAALYCILVVAMPLLSMKFIIGSTYLLTIDKYVFCALGLAAAVIMNRPQQPLPQARRFDLPIVLMLLLEFAQARDASATATLRLFMPALLTIALPYFLLSRSIRNDNDVRRFLLAFVLAGFAMALVATVEARLHWLIYKQIQGRLDIAAGINAYSKMRAGMLRAPASFPESTALGTFLALAFMAALSVRSSFKSRYKWFTVLGVLLLGLISANSRGAFLGLAVGLIAWDLYSRRYGLLVAKLVAGGALYLFALTAAQFSAYFAALVGKDSGTAGTADYRLQLLRRGMEEIHKHPFLGQTMKDALNNLQDLRQGEGIIDLVNGYISYGLSLGYLGILGLVLVFVSLCLTMWAVRSTLRRNPQLLDSAACVFAAAALSIPNSFFTGFGGDGSTSFYQMCALGSAIWALRRVAAANPGDASGLPAAPMSATRARILADREAARRPGGAVTAT